MKEINYFLLVLLCTLLLRLQVFGVDGLKCYRCEIGQCDKNVSTAICSDRQACHKGSQNGGRDSSKGCWKPDEGQANKCTTPREDIVTCYCDTDLCNNAETNGDYGPALLFTLGGTATAANLLYKPLFLL